MTLIQSKKNVKQKKRYVVVLLFLEEYAPKEISKVLLIPGKTVYNHIKAYEKGGLSALFIKKQCVQPKKLTSNQKAKLHFFYTHTRAGESGAFANWTFALACRLVKEKYDVTY